MRLKKTVALLVALLFIVSSVPAAAAGDNPVPVKVSASDLESAGGTFTVRPKALDLEDFQAVVIELEDKALIDEVDDQAAVGKHLSKEEQKAYVGKLRDKQEEIIRQIQKRGGHIVAQYQRVYNGIAARIKGKDIPIIAALPGVVGVHPVQVVYPDNETSVPFIGASEAWEKLVGNVPVDGTGIRVAVIDTGIDYTHATFGGAGTAAAYSANDPNVIEEGTFPTIKVVDGWDFAGTNYDASDPNSTPVPDPDPLDENGHGTHVAGTIAGLGVKAADGSWKVGPGVAPGALLYAYKVFGRQGSTDLVAEAIERAVDPNQDGDISDHVDVINMSLGSPFGSPGDVSAVAAQAAVKAGVIVVASAGNSGNVPYITGSPGVAAGVISVASSLDDGIVYNAIKVNSPDSIAGLKKAVEAAITPPLSETGPVTADLVYCGLGATPESIPDNVAGKIALIDRGVCTFAVKILNAQSKGAVAVIVANNQPGDPIVMGGDPQGIRIPAVMIGLTDGTAIKNALAAGPVNVTMSPELVIPRPELADTLSTFTSRGPGRTGSLYGKNYAYPTGGGFKPEVAAPGQDIRSAGMGKGDGATMMSGTSMASPHVAGMAALMRQLHPDWKVEEIKALLMNTATIARNLAGVPYQLSQQGAGRVQANEAASTDSVALPGAIAFGYVPVTNEKQVVSKEIIVVNKSDREKVFNVSWEFLVSELAGTGVTLELPAKVNVPAHERVKLEVRAKVDPSLLRDADPRSTFDMGLNEYGGYVFLSEDGGDYLRLPFTILPWKAPSIEATPETVELPHEGPEAKEVRAKEITLVNKSLVPGVASFYPLLGTGARSKSVPAETDLRYVGVRPVPGAGGLVLEFVAATYGPWSTLETVEFDFCIDVAGDGTVDYILFNFDLGYLTSGAFNGRVVSALYDVSNGKMVLEYYAGNYGTSYNTSVISLYVDTADMGLDPDGATPILSVPVVYAFGRENTDFLTCDVPELDLANPTWQVSEPDVLVPSSGKVKVGIDVRDDIEKVHDILILVLRNADCEKEAQIISIRTARGK